MAPVGHPSPDLTQADHGRAVLGQRVGGTMALLGASTSYLGAFTLSLSPMAAGAQLALAVGLTILGIVVLVARPSQVLFQLSAIWGVVSISAMLGTSDEFGTTPFFYLWPTVFVAYFCTPRALIVTLVTLVTTLVPALLVAPVPWAVRADLFIGTTVCVGLMAGLVSIMKTRETKLHAQLAHAAHTDPLTGLLNRRGFDPRFADLIDTSVQLGRDISVVMFDLDHFKRFNDRHGHLVGDEALRRVAGILSAQCRDVDLVARLGGEEFAAVLPGAGPEDALLYAERVARALGVEDVDASLRLSTSSGIGSFLAGDESVSALVLRADEALYAAKSAGRARSAWWNDGALVVGEPIDLPVATDMAWNTPQVPREYVIRRNDLPSEEPRARARA